MELTDPGRVLLRHALSIIREINEAEAGLREFAAGRRSIIRVAGVNSVIKALLPEALRLCGGLRSGIEVDIHEAAPGEALEMLYSRQADIGLIAADSVAQSSVGFRQVPMAEDPYVFAVPRTVDISAIEAAPENGGDVLNSCIQFDFGTQHTLRVQQWYQRVLPAHRIVAHCRTYEVALELVRAGFEVCRCRLWRRCNSRARSTASRFMRPITANAGPWRSLPTNIYASLPTGVWSRPWRRPDAA